MEGIDQRITLLLNSLYSPWSDPFWAFMSQIKVWFPMYALIAVLFVWKLGWKRGLVAVACIALAFFCDERVNNLIKELVGRVRPCNDPDMIAAGIHVLESGGGWSFPSGHACNSFGFAVCSVMCLKGLIRGRASGGPSGVSGGTVGLSGGTFGSGAGGSFGGGAGSSLYCDSEGHLYRSYGSGFADEESGRLPLWAVLYAVFIFTWAILVCISRVMVARHFVGDVLVGALIGSVMGLLWAWIAKIICKVLSI